MGGSGNTYRMRRIPPAPLFRLSDGLDILGELIPVRQVVACQHTQHHAQGLRASLVVLAGALQVRR